jgi:hypothetical protein
MPVVVPICLKYQSDTFELSIANRYFRFLPVIKKVVASA